MTPTTSPPAASASSATAPIIPTLPPPKTSRRPRSASPRPTAAAVSRYAGSAPPLEPQNTQTLARAGTPASCQARPPRDLACSLRDRARGLDLAASRRGGVLAAVARRDHHRGGHRPEDREPGADEERVVEALGE